MRLTTDFHAEQESSRQSTRKSAHENNSLTHRAFESPEYSALAARATNDAVRDWDVKSGRLAWPEGLTRLFGYTASIISQDIGFWQRHVHPDDRARTAASIRDALASAE